MKDNEILNLLYQTVLIRIIQFKENKGHHRKGKQRASSITEIRQRNTNGREKPHNHP